MWQFFIFMELNTFLIFCVYEDNESKYQEIDIRVDQQIFTQRKYQRIYRKRYPSSTRYEGGGEQLFIFMELEPFFYYFVVSRH